MRECALQPVGILRRHLGQLGIDQPRREAVYADTVGGEGLPQRLGQADRPGLRRGIGGIADIGLEPRNRTDDDDRSGALRQLRPELARYMHQAVEVDRHHPVPSLALELAAPIDDRALAQDQHIEPVERHRRRLDRVGVADIDAAIAEPRKIGPIVRVVIGRLRACPPDMDRRAARAKATGDAVADPARSANHQHRLSGEVGIVLHADPRRHAGSPDRPRRLAPHPVPAARADQGARPSAARRDR